MSLIITFPIPGTHERANLDVRQIFVSLLAPSPLGHVLESHRSRVVRIALYWIGPKNAFINNTTVVGWRFVAASQRVSTSTAYMQFRGKFCLCSNATLMVMIWLTVLLIFSSEPPGCLIQLISTHIVRLRQSAILTAIPRLGRPDALAGDDSLFPAFYGTITRRVSNEKLNLKLTR